MNSRRWSNVTKIIVTAALVILAIVFVVVFRAMISPTIVAFLLTFILSYPVNWIQRQTGWARGTTIAALYGLILALVALTPALLFPRLVALFLSLRTALEELIASLQTTAGPVFIFGGYQLSVDNVLQQIGDALQNILLLATANPMSILQGVTNGVLIVVYVLVVNFWLLKDLHTLQRLAIRMVPANYQEDMRRLGQELGEVWQAFLRGQLFVCLAMGSITWVALVIIGMPNAGGLALLAGVMEFLPSVGPGISGTIGTAVALFQGSTWLPVGHVTFAIIALIIYSITAQIENIYLVPNLLGGRVKLHPAVVFIGTINATIVFGALGVLLATPVIASARIIFSYLYHKLVDLDPFESTGPQQIGVRIRGLIGGRKIEALIFELDGTLTGLDLGLAEWASTHLPWLDRAVTPAQRQAIARWLMVRCEGTINFVISQLGRLQLNHDLKRVLPILDRLQGFTPVEQMTLLPGMAETLRELASRYQLGLVSTRDCDAVEKFLAHAGLADLFDVVVGREDVRNLLPHSESLLVLATRLNVDPNHILILSDTEINLRAGRAMEMATAGVLWGLGREPELQETDLILPTTFDLLEWL